MVSVDNQIRRIVSKFPQVRKRYRKRLPGKDARSATREGPSGNPVKTPPHLSLTCSIVICTRDRPSDLTMCLESMVRVKGERHEIIVVDNAPSSQATQDVVRRYQKDHAVRYVLERRPGLDSARNRGVLEAAGEIVAFTDDDCIVDENWLEALQNHYDDPEVACVTGLVAPWEVETRAQELFEFHYAGGSRGLASFSVDYSKMRATDAGRMGAGANMSFRKSVLLALGLFNEALDCGMPTMSGGDTYAFYKVLSAGYRITYEPKALVWHRHRRDREHLKKQIYGYGVGVASYLTACLVEDHDLSALGTAWSWFRYWWLRRLFRRTRGELNFPLRLLIAEFRGALAGPWAYYRARRIASSSRLADVPTLIGSELAFRCTRTDLNDSRFGG